MDIEGQNDIKYFEKKEKTCSDILKMLDGCEDMLAIAVGSNISELNSEKDIILDTVKALGTLRSVVKIKMFDANKSHMEIKEFYEQQKQKKEQGSE